MVTSTLTMTPVRNYASKIQQLKRQGCKRDLGVRDRDVRFSVQGETETETFPKFYETETLDFLAETRLRPRPC